MALFGGAWEAALGMMADVGTWIGEQITTFMLSEDAEYTIGNMAGYIVGMILWEVLLSILTSGVWLEAHPVIKAVVEFMDLGGMIFEAAFKLLGKLGGLLVDAVGPLISMAAKSPAMAALMSTFDELAQGLVRMADEVMAMMGFADEAAEGAAKHADEVLGGADEVAGGVARHGDEAAGGLDEAATGVSRQGDEALGQADEAAGLAGRQGDEFVDASGKTILAGSDEALATAASRIQPQPGVYDVVIHGDGSSFKVLDGGTWKTMTPE
jgi:hypothetical protein